MGWIRNILALIGLLVLVGSGAMYITVAPAITIVSETFAKVKVDPWGLMAKAAPAVAEFDAKYLETYIQFADKLLTTKDPGTAMVYSVRVKDGVSVEDVKESMKSLANAKNFLFVGEAPFYKQVQAITGKPYRHIAFMSFCDAKVGKLMADYNDVYTAFMPCRISVVEDAKGKLWLHTMSLDLMIYGGKELPPELKKEAARVWKVIQEIMQGAAAGEF